MTKDVSNSYHALGVFNLFSLGVKVVELDNFLILDNEPWAQPCVYTRQVPLSLYKGPLLWSLSF